MSAPFYCSVLSKGAGETNRCCDVFGILVPDVPWRCLRIVLRSHTHVLLSRTDKCFAGEVTRMGRCAAVLLALSVCCCSILSCTAAELTFNITAVGLQFSIYGLISATSSAFVATNKCSCRNRYIRRQRESLFRLMNYVY